MHTPRLFLLCALTVTLGAGASRSAGLVALPQSEQRTAESRQPERVREALDNLALHAPELGLDADTTFAVRTALTDSFGQTHVRVQQRWHGVPVWGAEAVAHLGHDGSDLGLTEDLQRGISVDVRARIGEAEALRVAKTSIGLKGPLAYAPTTRLVIVPRTKEVLLTNKPRRQLNALEVRRQVTGHFLAWHVHLATENHLDRTKSRDLLIDARTGRIEKSWDSLQSAGVKGTGASQYSGAVSLDTSAVSGGFELRDQTRGSGTGNETHDMANNDSTNNDLGNKYTDADNAWGNGQQYLSGSTTSATGQTAAVDAHFGLQKTWDYYGAVHARSGIDGSGTATYNRVHYPEGTAAMDNAFWSDDCFCMTFGDGAGGGANDGSLTTLDIAGHEMSHGVTANTSGLIYSDEPGGLNESTSDIHGTMVEFYARGGHDGQIGDTGGNWNIGEQLSTSPPLRIMYKPSLDGASEDEWSADLGSLDVHYSSGPMNRAFYFLSAGATTTGDTSTPRLPTGMTGLGNDKAARIWYRAQSVYLLPTSDYKAARSSSLKAARDLYGYGSTEFVAVQNAFAGINVGYSNGTFDDLVPPTVVAHESGTHGLIALSADATDNVGVAGVDFYIDSFDNYAGSSLSAPFHFDFEAAQLADGAHTLIAVGYDLGGNAGVSAPAPFTIDNGFSQLLQNPGFEAAPDGTLGWSGDPVIFYGDFPELARSGIAMAWLGGYTTTTTEILKQQVAIPTSTFPVLFSLWIDTESDGGDAADALKIEVRNAGDTATLKTLATVAGQVNYGRYVSAQYDLSAYKGQTVTIKLTGTDSGANATNWFVDDFSLRALKAPAATVGHADAFEVGSSGTILFGANVLDDHVTAKVEFTVDAVVKATVTTPPFVKTFNSTTLTDGAHALVAKVTDASGTVTNSAAVTFVIDNSQASPTVVQNPSFEIAGGVNPATSSGVTAKSWVLTYSSTSDDDTDYCNEFVYGAAPHEGNRVAVLAGCAANATSSLYQNVTVPTQSAGRSELSFWLRILNQGTGTLTLTVRNATTGALLKTLRTWTEADDTNFTYAERIFDLQEFHGQSVRIQFDAAQTSGKVRFRLDDFAWTTSAHADTVAPQVQAAVEGSAGPILLRAYATDNARLAKLEFFVDGNSVAVRPQESAEALVDVTFDSTTLTSASHTLTVTATDGAGNPTTSTPVTFQVQNTPADHNAPTITVSISSAFLMSADVHDDTGVAEVDYLVDGAFAASATAAPFQKTLTMTLAEGSHSLTGRAIDVFGNTATSAPVTFTVAALSISIDPTHAAVAVGEQFTFQAVLTATGVVNWSVQESAGGSVSTAGVYTAPATVGDYHVIATAAADTSKKATATVRVYSGDLDTDGNVDGLDMQKFAAAFGAHTGDAAFDAQTDLNADGAIDDQDLNLFLARFGR